MSGRRHRQAWPWFVAALLLALSGCMTAPQPGPYLVFFRTDSADLTPEAKQIVGVIATAAHDQPRARITVEGHADGDTASDAALAERRAAAVREALAGAGVDASRIEKQPGAPPQGVTGVAAHQVIVRLSP